jgi:hypothetical protein
MNARERKLLSMGINPLTGGALASPVLAPATAPRVAQAATIAPWIAEAKAAAVAVTAAGLGVPAVADMTDRLWYDTGERGVSNSGRDTIVLLSGMRNGGFFRATFPGDAVRAIAAGKVLRDGKPAKF